MSETRTPEDPSSSAPGAGATEALPPGFPQRAPWGTADRLRAWQQEALDQYFASDGPDGPGRGPRDFLAAATPGAGKTAFALRLAARLRREGVVEQVIVVAPTAHLKQQWAAAAARLGLRLDPAFRNAASDWPRGFHGAVVTYAQVAAAPWVHERITLRARTLVILDEVHHGGDALSWGDALRTAFARASRRVLLSGTPFRSDRAPIPFVEYHPDARGARVSRTDYAYGYGRALQDGVVRPVLFLVYAGRMRWRTRALGEMEARLGHPDTAAVTAQAWRAALDPGGQWIPQVLRSADRRLTEVRRQVPDAGGLVIASDQAAARAYAAVLESITAQTPALVLSDDPAATRRIEAFADSRERWMVAVRMVSEGVDVPRLCVGVYATSAATPLYFAQAVGRFVRARRRGELASIFLPDVPALLALASEMERERSHVLHEPGSDGAEWDPLAGDSSAREEAASAELLGPAFEPLESEAEFDRVLYQGDSFGQWAAPGSDEEQEFIGLPGLLDQDQVTALLRHRQARQSRRRVVPENGPERTGEAPMLHRTLREQRQLLHSLVGLRARQTGQPHAEIHAELRRRCGGPPVAQATVDQLQQRIETARALVRS